MDIPELKETQRQGIVFKPGETMAERSERLRKLETIWSDGRRQSLRNEAAFFQGLLDEEAAEQGEIAVNLYPEVFPHGVEIDPTTRTYREFPHP